MVRDAKRCDRRRDERHEPVAPRERPTHKWLEVDMDAPKTTLHLNRTGARAVTL